MGGVICYRGEESRAGGEVRLELGRKGIRGGWGEGLRGMGRGLAGELCGADRGAGIGNTCGTHWITLCGMNDLNN